MIPLFISVSGNNKTIHEESMIKIKNYRKSIVASYTNK